MKRVNFHLTDRHQKELRRLSERYEIPVAELIRRALDAYLEQEIRKEKKRHDAANDPDEG